MYSLSYSGLEICRQLGLHGASISIMGRRQHVLNTALNALHTEGIKAIGTRGDVRKVEDCQAFVSNTVREYGGLNVLVNSAAGNFLAAAETLKPKGFQTVLDIDTLGVFTM